MESGVEERPGEAEAWAEVLAGWDDEARHRAYLALFTDLEGLAAAGRRYRDVLAERPDDAVALRWRDEVVKRATVAGLAALPRAKPAAEAPRWLKPAALALGVAVLAWVILAFVRPALDLFLARGRP